MFGRYTSSHLVGQKEKVAFGCPHKYLVGGAPFGAHPPNGSLMGTPCTDTLKDSSTRSSSILLKDFIVLTPFTIYIHRHYAAFFRNLHLLSYLDASARLCIYATTLWHRVLWQCRHYYNSSKCKSLGFCAKQCKSNHLQNKTVQHDLLHRFDRKS